MGTEIASQLRTLCASLLLGTGLALLYDLLRALRLRRKRQRWFTELLDGAYCAALLLSGLAFALRIGEGELRLYSLAAAGLGAFCFFRLLSPVLRPLWDFWAGVFFRLLRLLRLPFQAMHVLFRRAKKISKRLFLFWRHSFIIASYRHMALGARKRAGIRRGRIRHGGEGKKKHRPADRAVCSGHAAVAGRAAAAHERSGGRRPRRV